ncbi:MAG TPA: delta(1)-pyrroline-2-carboxylate reductase family protein [Noviherbaspirillum sp.]|nr:delta(1)-pyrroline-2-carboxylate reductase family protein [Noviherbaspirillum sp.]
MQILDFAETTLVLPYSKLVPAIALAAHDLASGVIKAPERQVVALDPSSVLLCMPAIGADIGVTKLITVHSKNAQHHLPAIQGEVIVFDTATGRRRAILDGPTVTARRTAAVTLLGIQKLMPAVPTSALLIGTGAQAGEHALALIDFFGVSHLRIASRTLANAQALCAALVKHHPHVSALAVDFAELPMHCQEVDVVIALTTATTPVVPAQLPPQTLAVGVGAFKPDMAELPAELLHTREIVVDHLAGAQHEAGDLIRAHVNWNGVRDLADVLMHGRNETALAPVLKTVGHAAWDLAAARVAIEAIG